ncbi:hypothetical protein [Actinokineospora sp. NBRC 105648]|uniref:hypothetical protein n=1 Tax=Actinokineospora sp. NBRC 105648 TaxID=3032206 RepID=UPI002554392A|nr:hypothetical protein [Actinokineospora sp. NBRC 105648]
MTSLRSRLVAWCVLAVVSWINLVSHAPWQRDAHLSAYGDALEYYRMSEQTFAPVDNPFALRVLTPWLVRKLHQISGISPDSVWIGFTFVTTLAAVLLFHSMLLRHFKVSAYTALLVAGMLACTFWYAPYLFGNPWLVDPLNNLLYVAAIWLALDRRLLWFTAVVVVGTVNKETTLLLAPLYPLLALARTRKLTDRSVLAGAAATVVAAGLYFAFRLWAQARIGGDYALGAGQANKSLMDNIRFALASAKGRDQLAIWSVFSFAWLIWLYGLYRLRVTSGLRHPLIVTSAWVFFCCLFGRVLATDTERVFVMLAPVLLAVIAVTLDHYAGPAQRPWLLAIAAMYVARQLHWVSDPVTFIIDVVALGVFAAIVTLTHRNTRPAATIEPEGAPSAQDVPAGRSAGVDQ